MLNGGRPKPRNLRLAARSGFSVRLVERSLIPLIVTTLRSVLHYVGVVVSCPDILTNFCNYIIAGLHERTLQMV
jgi:hypothetical protein